MASLNDDLKVRNHAEIAPTTFVQEVVRIILLVAKKQISVEEARLQSIALTPALRAISTHSDLNETSDRSSGVCILPSILLILNHHDLALTTPTAD
jgi:hypothetical protein